MAVRMTWKGQLNLGLVSIPVGMATAVREKGVKFQQFTADLHPVGRQAYDKETGEILSSADVHKGFMVGEQVVLLTDEELESVSLESTKALDVQCVVEDIDPLLYASHQWLVPQEGAEAVYDLLVHVLSAASVVALAVTVRRNKKHVVAIHSDGKALLASFLHYVDEVVDAPYQAKPMDAKLQKHRALMTELLTGMLKPVEEVATFTDDQREKVLAMIEAKASGAVVDVIEAPVKDTTVSLLDALEASISGKGMK